MSTAADFITLPNHRPSHPAAACLRLLARFAVDVAHLRTLMPDNHGEGGHREHDRAIVERLASTLWGVFSHHRAVVDAAGAHYDLGSWRSAGEFIADVVNRRYPHLNPPIRYMDCYMGILLGDDQLVESRPLYRWIFTNLRDAGCDWIYGYSPDVAPPPGSPVRRARMREVGRTLSLLYHENGGGDFYAPLPTVVAAYHEVYGRLPDGWPAC